MVASLFDDHINYCFPDNMIIAMRNGVLLAVVFADAIRAGRAKPWLALAKSGNVGAETR